jgi:outer membrane protein assembly factor BamB
VNNILILIIFLLFLSNCSSNKNPLNWKKEQVKIEDQQNVKKAFKEDKVVQKEFNSDLRLDLSNIVLNNKTFDNKNNLGSQNYNGLLNKVGNYKFSKLTGFNQLNFKPTFFNNDLIFFDKKGSVIKYNENYKVSWSNNYYSKSEKKLNPKLNFLVANEDLLVADNISKLYSINLKTKELNWIKQLEYPFNSEIKKNKNKIFAVDYKNTLRCYSIIDGSECWNLQTEDSFTISDSRYSLIIIQDMVIFSNSLGDITAVDIQTGLIIWQLPTQSSSIINETYSFKISKIISDGNSIFFSNNKNEFYSVNVKTGVINWSNKINSNINSVISGNLIFTVSNDGYLFVTEKNTGNIIRVTYLYKEYEKKGKEKISPIGFVIGNKNLFLTNNDGKMIVVELELGKIIKTEPIAKNSISEPFIFNKNLFVIKNGYIIQYN